MKRFLYIAEGLAFVLTFYVLISSYDGGCMTTSICPGYGDKLASEHRMLAKYRDKILNARKLNRDKAPPVEPKDGGCISGQVLGEGTPLEGVWVDIYDTRFSYVGSGRTDSLGYYIVCGLSDTIVYKAKTWNNLGYVDKWWDNKPNFWSADTIVVVEGDTTTDINFNLPLGGYISGRVTAEGKDGIPGVWVDVWDPDWNYVSSGYTDSLGFYVTGNMEEGIPYRVSTWNDQNYVDEWWDDKPDIVYADTIMAVSGDTLENIDFSLVMGSAISGTVTGPDKQPLEGIMVQARSVVNGGFVKTDWNGTDSLGHYVITGLPVAYGFVSGYRVRVVESTPYAHQWYNGKYSFTTADVVDVTQPGDTVTGIDFQLELGGIVKGVVTDENMDSLPGVGIYVYDNTSNSPLEPVAFTVTGWWPVMGSYELALLPGTYRIRTFNIGRYIDEYYDDQISWDDATLVTVNVSETTYVNFSLSVGATIEGTVYRMTQKDGMVPFPRVAIVAIRANTGELITFVNSFLDGTYKLRGLPTGWYKLYAFPSGDMFYPTWANIMHAPEFYNNKLSWATADSIYVSAPDSVITGIDFVLGAGGAIAGRVSDYPKAPIEGAQVTAFTYSTPHYGWIPIQAPAVTDAAGDYVIPGLSTGEYKVRAAAEGYPTKWWDNRSDSSNADLVSVTAPDTTEGIDFYLLLGIEEADRTLTYELCQNQPNPFTHKTYIQYSIAGKKHVLLRLYDITGRLVKTLVDGIQKPGHYTVEWDGTDTEGKKLSVGIYFYRLDAGNFRAIKKLILVH